jgi:predicted dehydrogenase
MVKTVSIIGLGARGAETYGRYCMSHKNQFKIVALFDINKEKIEKYKTEFNIAEKNCFNNEDNFFNSGKHSDVIFICSQDRDHVRQAIKACKAGYDILLEKPISPFEEECRELVKVAMESKANITVCHVLRYAVFYEKIKQLISNGEIGEIIAYNQIENVAFWHQAHSFVRGNWRKKEDTSPMILAKCCHDFDIIRYMIGKKCESVSSFGSLKHFTKENAPKGSAERCLDCSIKSECPYNAEKFYIENFRSLSEEEKYTKWPYFMLAEDTTEENLYKALREGIYGRCVYHCDNDVVDHQTVNMQFENGITANLLMCAFTYDGGRQIKVMGSLGEIYGDEINETITIGIFNKPLKVYKLKELTNQLDGHGGGDSNMLNRYYYFLNDKNSGYMETSIINSVESHLIAFAAEKSRLNKGMPIHTGEYNEKN